MADNERIPRPNPASLFEVRGELAVDGLPSQIWAGREIRITVTLPFEVAHDLWLADQYRESDEITYRVNGPTLKSSEQFEREQAVLKAGPATRRETAAAKKLIQRFTDGR